MSENKKSNLQDIMMAADMVDTIRNEIRKRDDILSEKDREHQIRRDLIEYYKSQNIEVSDAIINQAFAQLNENRYTFVSLDDKKWSTKFATLWVARHMVAKHLSILIAISIALYFTISGLQYVLIDRPKELQIAKNTHLIDVEYPKKLSELESKLSKTSERIVFSSKLIEDLKNAKEAAYTALQERNIQDAERSLEILSNISKTAENEADAQIMQSTVAGRKIALAKTEMDDDARNFMAPMISELESLAKNSKNKNVFNVSLKKFEKELNYIKEPLELRIVDRNDSLSGVWRTNNGGDNKFYYLIVEAVDANGKAYPLDITNAETGKTNTVYSWGINVPESEFKKVASDKKANGIISNRDAGKKMAGTRKIEWDRPVLKNRMITKW